MLKLHLIDSLSMLYSQLCNKYSGKSNTWNVGLSLSEATSAVGATNSCPPSAALCITPQLCIQNGSRQQNHAPFGRFVITLARLNIVSLCTKFDSSRFSHSWDMDGASKIWNVSRDVTTPISGTVCRPSARTSYGQPVYQIWSLYVYSLRRNKRRRKMQKLGWFGG